MATHNKDQQPPVYSRELTLQAHFTFGTAAMAPVQYAQVTPTSTSALGGRPLMTSGTPHEHWRWNGGGGAAQCSITCGREGLTMTYNAPPAATHAHHALPCPICSSLVAGRSVPPVTTVSHDAVITTTTTSSSPIFTRSLVDLSRPQEQLAARSLTFSGSLDRATQRPVQQRPYGRRCKSTAHIVLQNNESQETRPHEFHHTLRADDAPLGRPEAASRGRARHRAAPDTEHGAVGGWERLHPLSEEQDPARRASVEGGEAPLLPPCCPCHHCSALYSLVSSLAHERTCHACAHHHHHHHPPCSPTPQRSQGPPRAADPLSTQPKSPTVRTFNSHRCYEEEGEGPRRLERSHPRSRSPSPRMVLRGRSASPHSSPSPDRRGDGAEDRHPHTTPQMPRRVPRMGAAAAAVAAASTHTAVQVH